jgi:large subunit ribosomal protein L35
LKKKLKTHRGAAKRFRRTASGKLKRSHAFAKHIATKKTRHRKRKLRKSTLVSKADHSFISPLLPYS